MIMILIKAIPSVITSLNLICGVAASIFAFSGEPQIAIYLVLASAVFDFFDGFAARLLKAVSEFGKQLDSLADLISFGFAPAALLFNLLDSNNVLSGYWPFIVILIVLFSALRLAKFNTDSSQATGFVGLPTPASALLIIAISQSVINAESFIYHLFLKPEVAIITIVLISALMVLPIRLLSLKIKKFDFKEHYLHILLFFGSISLLIIFGISGLALSIILYLAQIGRAHV